MIYIILAATHSQGHEEGMPAEKVWARLAHKSKIACSTEYGGVQHHGPHLVNARHG